MARKEKVPPAPPRLTVTERRILDLLGDGRPHPQEELMGCLWDEMSEIGALRRVLSVLRKKIIPLGENVVPVRDGQVACYQRFKLITHYGPPLLSENTSETA